ncbi:hypothetical protein GCM10009021_24600 [Halarchaeum nitratireducens]|uniref:Uncharacterized protein n=1 Tax=Halarchaeum nitratireducens TaxID=489913 RepID=A0A830GDX4_9EURY|nr:hypothetical protein GCM10009021_24600 [Halarchaeum nitratireducens]
MRTETESPLTATERRRARQIALRNQTVRTGLAALENYTVTVKPIHELTLPSEQAGRYNATETDESADTGDVFTIATVTSDDGDGTVVVHREPAYVTDRAVVQIRQPNAPQRHELAYSVRVDLANGTVTMVTDWEAIRANSPAVGSRGVQNATISPSQDGKVGTRIERAHGRSEWG